MQETRSATAVEFAMIGSVLFLFLLGILVMGVVQFWQLTLDDSVRNATRQLQIGPAKVPDGPTFIGLVCNEFGLATTNCGTATLQYNVQGAQTFAVMGQDIVPATLSAAGVLSGSPNFQGVVRGNPVLVQVAYKLPFAIPLIPYSILTMNGTPSIISASSAIEEP